MNAFDEYSPLKRIALRTTRNAFDSDARLDREWQNLRYHARPDFQKAIREHDEFLEVVRTYCDDVILLEGDESLTLDSIYTRDALIVSPKGLILCGMGRSSRQHEPHLNARQLEKSGALIAGSIASPGTVEGGDFVWLDERNAAVGYGPRTNRNGIEQLQRLLGENVNLHIVPLPAPDHPDDVFHLMSMISPLDNDLALIYRPLMPDSFMAWLADLGIQFVEVPEVEFLPMGCNVLALAPRQVLMLDQLPETRRRLQNSGCQVTTYGGEEISRKGEGGPTCLTRPLVRGA